MRNFVEIYPNLQLVNIWDKAEGEIEDDALVFSLEIGKSEE